MSASNKRQASVKVRTGVQAGGRNLNHNERQATVKVRTGVQAGRKRLNHNELLVAPARGAGR